MKNSTSDISSHIRYNKTKNERTLCKAKGELFVTLGEEILTFIIFFSLFDIVTETWQ
jgi:hypothetical protein